MTDDTLHNNFVTGDVQLLCLLLDVNNDLFCDLLMLGVIEFLTLELGLDAVLNDLLDLSGVESLVLSWLHPVGGQVSHARVSEIDHLFCFS